MNKKDLLIGLYLIMSTVILIILTCINFESIINYFLKYKPEINVIIPSIIISITILVLWFVSRERKNNGSSAVSRTINH